MDEQTENIKPRKPRKIKVSTVAIETGEVTTSDELLQLDNIKAAAEIIFDHYRKGHTMRTPDDFHYPGLKELYTAIYS